jgi:hypothetical protein
LRLFSSTLGFVRDVVVAKNPSESSEHANKGRWPWRLDNIIRRSNLKLGRRPRSLDSRRSPTRQGWYDPTLEALLEDVAGRKSGTPAKGCSLVTDQEHESKPTPKKPPESTSRWLRELLPPEWFDGGGLKRFVDDINDRPYGISVTWDKRGKIVDRLTHRQGSSSEKE